MTLKQLESAIIQVERAASELRRGLAVVLISGKESALVSAAETAQPSQLKSGNMLVLTTHRARVLGLEVKRGAGVEILLNPSLIKKMPLLMGTDQRHAKITLPESKKQMVMKSGALATAALELAKIAELAPAVLVQKKYTAAQAKGLFSLNAAALANFDETQAGLLKPVVEAPLTLKQAHQAKIIGFRAVGSGREHYAIVVGHPKKSPAPLTRIHSSCYTGDLLASLKCDCRDQLQEALHYMAENGGGVLLYLMQEGRGIGLINKLRAYHLQAGGMDTVEANEALGFEDDARPFFAASQILKSLGFKKVRLMTNNPRKVKGLEACGIKVAERVDHVMAPHVHNEQYLKTKFSRLGHIGKKNG